MAVDHKAVVNDGIFLPLGTQEAIKAFDTGLKSTLERIIIGGINFSAIRPKDLEKLPVLLSDDLVSRISGRNQQTIVPEKIKPLKTGSGDRDYGSIESEVRKIWKKILGYEEVGENENFFEAGGDSVMITSMHASFEELFPGLLSIADLFAYQTIQKLSECIHSRINPEKTAPEKIENEAGGMDMLKLIEEAKKGGLSMEEAMKKLEKMR